MPREALRDTTTASFAENDMAMASAMSPGTASVHGMAQ